MRVEEVKDEVQVTDPGMGLVDAIYERRSVRGFLNKEVPQEVLNRIFEIAQKAPSNCNVQPWKVYVASGELKDKLKQKSHRANRAINDRIQQEEEIQTQIKTKLNKEKESALNQIFSNQEKENVNLSNVKSDNEKSKHISISKEGPLLNSLEEAKKLKGIQIRKIPENKSKIELKFTEKVYPHLAMREKFLQKLPDPKPKNEKNNTKDEHNYLFYKDKGDEFLQKGDIDGAIEAYTICLELNKDCIKALINKSLAYFRKLNYTDSLNDIDNALKILSEREDILQFRGWESYLLNRNIIISEGLCPYFI